MKKYLFCSLVFLVLVFITPGFADEHFPFLAEVSKESVNVRAGPSTNFAKVDKLNKGDKVVVLGRSYEWLKVQPTSGSKSYIRSDYLKSEGRGIAVVTGDDVNIRAQANSDSASLGEIKRGTVVRVMAETNGWSQLSPVGGTAVWIHQDFLKEVSPDVPASLLIPAVPVPVPAETGQANEASAGPGVSMRGTIEALVQPLAPDVHYEMVLDNKSVFLLQDMPQISFFCNTLVNIEGTIIPDPHKKLMYPLLRINKITLVL